MGHTLKRVKRHFLLDMRNMRGERRVNSSLSDDSRCTDCCPLVYISLSLSLHVGQLDGLFLVLLLSPIPARTEVRPRRRLRPSSLWLGFAGRTKTWFNCPFGKRSGDETRVMYPIAQAHHACAVGKNVAFLFSWLLLGDRVSGVWSARSTSSCRLDQISNMKAVSWPHSCGVYSLLRWGSIIMTLGSRS